MLVDLLRLRDRGIVALPASPLCATPKAAASMLGPVFIRELNEQ